MNAPTRLSRYDLAIIAEVVDELDDLAILCDTVRRLKGRSDFQARLIDCSGCLRTILIWQRRQPEQA